MCGTSSSSHPLSLENLSTLLIPTVGAYFDVGNVLLPVPRALDKDFGSGLKVHFKDYRREPGGFGSFVDLLAGDVNYPQ